MRLGSLLVVEYIHVAMPPWARPLSCCVASLPSCSLYLDLVNSLPCRFCQLLLIACPQVAPPSHARMKGRAIWQGSSHSSEDRGQDNV